MILTAEILLYFLCALVVNSFFIYPAVAFFMSRKNTGTVTIFGFEPSVSILIAAYNEEKVIEERVKNIASLNYDLNKLEVFIGSDMSTDKTNEILIRLEKEYPWLNVNLAETRKGKAGILNDLIGKAQNDILIFTDANTEFQPDAVKNLVNDFSDEKVGGVCGRLVLIDDESVRSEGVEETKYWQYETNLKRAEGKSGLLLAANGGIFAIRKNLYKQIPTSNAVTDDLFISLSVVNQNYRFTYREDAVAYENTGKNLISEYNRKVRFGATNFQTLLYFKNLLSPKNIKVAYAFFSHKVTRWFLPAVLFMIFVLSAALADENFLIHKFFLLQIAFYLLALSGYLLSLIKVRITVFSLPYFFVVSNIAIVEGFIRFIKRKHSVIWDSTQR